MKEEIVKIRNQFRPLNISLKEFYLKNHLNLGLTIDVKEFIRKIEDLQKKFESTIPQELRKNKEKLIKQKTYQEKKKPIILYSKRSSKIDDNHICSQCDVKNRPIYKYAQSNYGEVFLCSYCKIKVFNRSFKPAGAEGENLIGKLVLSGGAWESNRRKH